jgi:hypothetical protein
MLDCKLWLVRGMTMIYKLLLAGVLSMPVILSSEAAFAGAFSRPFIDHFHEISGKPVPGPEAGAGLPLLVIAAAYFYWRRRKTSTTVERLR